MPQDKVSEDFYKEFWRKPGWSSADPNDDEKTRAQIIMRLIEEKINPFFKEKKPLRILDLGCGRGWLTHVLSQYGQSIGADPCEAAVQRANELFPTLDFRNATAEQLVSQGHARTFDLIVSSEVIEHIVDKDLFLASIYSLLDEGGFAILTSPRGELRDYWVKHHPGYDQPVEIWITESSLDDLSRSAGFKVIARDRIFVPLRINLICKIAQSKKLSSWQVFPPIAWLFQRIRYHYGLYQIILLQKIS